MDKILDSDFDPFSLTIPQLMSTLSKYDIELPAERRKKAFYADLFQDHLEYIRRGERQAAKLMTKITPILPAVQEKVELTSKPVLSRTPSKISTKSNKSTPKLVSTPNPFQSPLRSSLREVVNLNSPAKKTPKAKVAPIDLMTPTKRTPAVLNTPTSSFKTFHVPSVSPSELKERLLKRKRSPNGSYLKPSLVAFFTVAVLLFAFWLAVEYPTLQYCTANSNTRCIECPVNSVCFGRTVTGCIGETKPKKSLLSRILPSRLLLFPLDQPSCSIDMVSVLKENKKQRQVEHLVRVLDQIVREHLGNVICSGLNESRKGMPIGLARSELKKMGKWTDAKFDDYWTAVTESIVKGDTMNTVIDNGDRLIASLKGPLIPYSCAVKEAVWKALVRYAVHLMLAGMSMIASLVLYLRYNRHIWESKIAATLIDDVAEAIHKETDNYHDNPSRHPIPGLSISQLADHFLRTAGEGSDLPSGVYSVDSQAKLRIWKRVKKVLSKNSNIRETSAHIKGEAHSVYMWVGSTSLTPLKPKIA